jgi:hypothetical protein
MSSNTRLPHDYRSWGADVKPTARGVFHANNTGVCRISGIKTKYIHRSHWELPMTDRTSARLLFMSVKNCSTAAIRSAMLLNR